jgi:hypothetical protein
MGTLPLRLEYILIINSSSSGIVFSQSDLGGSASISWLNGIIDPISAEIDHFFEALERPLPDGPLALCPAGAFLNPDFLPNDFTSPDHVVPMTLGFKDSEYI